MKRIRVYLKVVMPVDAFGFSTRRYLITSSVTEELLS